MEFKVIDMEIPDEANIILGQTHFIKTAEDLYEIMASSSPQIKFGIAFCEASGPCLVRAEGNDEELKKVAIKNASALSCGHVFVILLKNAFPINVLNAIKMCPEVCSVFCATANPVQVIVVETKQGRGVAGVIDGFFSKGVEKEEDIKARKKLLRDFGYKL
ncbi:adenosine-specific kinase [Candidatus Aerophobetes bacterium]|nr:adenosine-specific kinase [Candidatus Aerophobetes bacterium]